MRKKYCRVCGEIYSEILEIRRLENIGFCTDCAWSNPFCRPDTLWRWRLNRAELPDGLAERFDWPLETIHELLEYLTEEELFDVLTEMEDAGTLAVERERLEAERRAAENPKAPPSRSA